MLENSQHIGYWLQKLINESIECTIYNKISFGDLTYRSVEGSKQVYNLEIPFSIILMKGPTISYNKHELIFYFIVIIWEIL